MRLTPYSLDNRVFSDKAHAHARVHVYPRIFGKGVEVRSATLSQDMRDGIDYIASVPVLGLHAPLIFRVQERFRRPEVAHYGDVTISEWYQNSNRPAELYTTKADYFLYGTYSCTDDRMTDVLLVNADQLRLMLATGKLPFRKHVNASQGKYFLCVSMELVKRAGLVTYPISA